MDTCCSIQNFSWSLGSLQIFEQWPRGDRKWGWRGESWSGGARVRVSKIRTGTGRHVSWHVRHVLKLVTASWQLCLVHKGDSLNWPGQLVHVRCSWYDNIRRSNINIGDAGTITRSGYWTLIDAEWRSSTAGGGGRQPWQFWWGGTWAWQWWWRSLYPWWRHIHTRLDPNQHGCSSNDAGWVSGNFVADMTLVNQRLNPGSCHHIENYFGLQPANILQGRIEFELIRMSCIKIQQIRASRNYDYTCIMWSTKSIATTEDIFQFNLDNT